MKEENTATRIHKKLTEAFKPILLEIEDESRKHAGHAGHRPSGETHFRVKIVSTSFTSLTKVAQHRAVYDVLSEDMKEGGIHALALQTDAPK
jgi:BolA family transcriptional regulator, general stress-responsive regulator